jgi:ABC-type uncharacterized transport system permease subunit
MMELLLVPLLDAMIRTATPLAFAALGELVAERSGVIDIGLEGAIIAGCFGALLAAPTGSVLLGFAGAATAGLLITSVFALFVVTWRGDQIITGTAITLLGLGLTGTLHRAYVASASAPADLPALASIRVPGLASIPVIGEPLFDQPPTTYALYLLVPALAWWMYRTHAGLALRATGEDPVAARNAGIRTGRVRWGALLFSGAMAGIAGGTLVLAQVGAFSEGMSAGRGFIAISIVVLGRWSVRGTTLAALVFGGAFAMQYAFQSTGWQVPYQVFLAAPYVLTLVLLATLRGRVAAPAALAK